MLRGGVYDLLAANDHRPVHMLKFDISEGFYCVWLSEADIPKLAVALPCAPGEVQLIAMPHALSMGWVESP